MNRTLLGWGHLRVQTRGNTPESAYAAGLLEGVLTERRMLSFYENQQERLKSPNWTLEVVTNLSLRLERRFDGSGESENGEYLVFSQVRREMHHDAILKDAGDS